jgi:hypothetical protein
MTCREVTLVITRGELESESAGRREALRLHLVTCPSCRRYAAQLRALGESAQQLLGKENADLGSLERLRSAIFRRAEPDDTGNP